MSTPARTEQPLAMTVEQAARVLGVGRSTAYRAIQHKELRYVRIRSRILVPTAAIAEFLAGDARLDDTSKAKS